jgi:hypothetical protein
MGEVDQLDDKRPPEGQKKKNWVSREGRGSVSSAASLRQMEIEKFINSS